ncbi:Glutathione S-transferase 1 [Folsomia candida]|uniref:glutathione transferase n=1 Tax=Folsomia candida TaxID=158441 RepID=A0A226D5F4_FOLCA|nr:Glutathione S-transferase 1 [Folsomia candida]
MSQYKLTYYDLQGLGEPARYLFKVAGVEFEDHRIPKNESTYPKLPADLKDLDGKTIAQSSAICRFLALRFNLAGADEFEQAKCDEIIDAMRDFGRELMGVTMVPDEDAKKGELFKQLKEVTIPFYMGKFDKIAQENEKWLVGKNMTWVDIVFAHCMTIFMNRSKIPLVDGYPALKKLIDDFYAVPQIKEWIAQRPNTD